MEKIYIVKCWYSNREDVFDVWGVYDSLDKAEKAITQAIEKNEFPGRYSAFHAEEMRINDTWRKVVIGRKNTKGTMED